MIIEHFCQGSKATTLHNFIITQSGMIINVSAGTYTQQNVDKYTSATIAKVTIPTPTVQTYYEIWLANNGLVVLSRADGQQFSDVINPIDCLSWFTVPANAISLDSVNVDVVRMK